MRRSPSQEPEGPNTSLRGPATRASSRVVLGIPADRRPRIGFATGASEVAPGERILAPDEGHVLTVAPTGSGKGRGMVITTALTYRGPMTIVDPKGECAAVTARRRRTLGPVAILDPFRLVTDAPDSFNPLDVGTRIGGVGAFALMVVEWLRGEQHAAVADPFWETRAGMLLAGSLAHILTGPPEGRHLVSLRRLLADQHLDTALSALVRSKEPLHPLAREEFGQYLQICADRTRPSVLSTAQQHVRLIGDEAVAAALERTTFDVAAAVDGAPCTIYLVLPPSKLRSHAPLLRLWIGALMNAMIERRHRPELPTLFVLDEAAQLGSLGALRTAMTLMRAYGVRVLSIWQDLAQLRELYGADWQTIVNNASVLQAFGVRTWLMARELADVMGAVEPGDLLALGPEEQVLSVAGGRPEVARRLDYLRDPEFAGLYDENPLYAGRALQEEARGELR